jgi:hypothetical protein
MTRPHEAAAALMAFVSPLVSPIAVSASIGATALLGFALAPERLVLWATIGGAAAFALVVATALRAAVLWESNRLETSARDGRTELLATFDKALKDHEEREGHERERLAREAEEARREHAEELAARDAKARQAFESRMMITADSFDAAAGGYRQRLTALEEGETQLRAQWHDLNRRLTEMRETLNVLEPVLRAARLKASRRKEGAGGD